MIAIAVSSCIDVVSCDITIEIAVICKKLSERSEKIKQNEFNSS